MEGGAALSGFGPSGDAWRLNARSGGLSRCGRRGVSETLDFVDEYLSLLKPSQPAGAWAKARSIDDNAIWRKMLQKWRSTACRKKLHQSANLSSSFC